MSKRQELIEKLKAIRLEKFRDAADLDRRIQDLELVTGDPAGPEWIHCYDLTEAEHREDSVKICGWDKLCEQEAEIGRQLRELKEES